MSAGVAMIVAGVLPFAVGWWQTYRERRLSSLVVPTDLDAFWLRVTNGPKIFGDTTAFSVLEPEIIEDLDYSNVENWFSAGVVHSELETAQTYLLDIEKLNIANALVKVGGTNIDKNLVQFNTDVSIGEYGAPVIFGHSMLRQFYNPKQSNKDRYRGIFSTIMTLEDGDEIKVTVDSLTYTYVVVDKTTVQPDDDFILAQNTSRRQLKLVTCTPEGTRLRRGVVTAELKS